jgi:hypothetical protein
MKLFPYKEFIIETQLSEDEVKKSLMKLFSTKNVEYSSPFAPYLNSAEKRNYYGYIKENTFKIFIDFSLPEKSFFGNFKKDKEQHQLITKGIIKLGKNSTHISITISTPFLLKFTYATFLIMLIPFIILGLALEADHIILLSVLTITTFLSLHIGFILTEMKKMKKFLLTFFKNS